MKLKEKLALRAAEKLVKKMKKEDLLVPLRIEIEKLGLAGTEEAIDAAMERIEKSGLKAAFAQLGITKEDIKEAFKK